MHTHQLRSRLCSHGFTLLELLVVVTILAIVGAGLITAYDRLDLRSSKGVAAHTLAATDAALRAHTSHTRNAPSDFDSLIAASYPSNPGTQPVSSTGAAKLAILPSKLLSKTLPVHTLTQAQASSLISAGITTLRYVDPLGNDPANPAPKSGSTVTLSIPDADGNAAVVGPLLEVDIPHRVHEVPRPGSNRNRGRGFSGRIGAGSPVLVWNANVSNAGTGTGGYDNLKLKAAPDDLLVVLGLGNDTSAVGAGASSVQLASAPVFGGNDQSYQYGRYLVLYNIGPAAAPFPRARMQAVLNTHGDFVDEMVTEFSGQKSL